MNKILKLAVLLLLVSSASAMKRTNLKPIKAFSPTKVQPKAKPGLGGSLGEVYLKKNNLEIKQSLSITQPLANIKPANIPAKITMKGTDPEMVVFNPDAVLSFEFIDKKRDMITMGRPMDMIELFREDARLETNNGEDDSSLLNEVMALENVIKKNNVKLINKCIASKHAYLFNEQSSEDCNMLMYAIKHGRARTVEFLLENEIFDLECLNEVDRFGRTALMYAVSNKEMFGLVVDLLDRRVKLHQVDQKKRNALAYAVMQNHDDCEMYIMLQEPTEKNIKEILEQHENLEYIAYKENIYTVNNGKPELLKVINKEAKNNWLIDVTKAQSAGSIILLEEQNKKTITVNTGHVQKSRQIIKVLLRRGAASDSIDSDGLSVLDHAVIGKNFVAVNMLLNSILPGGFVQNLIGYEQIEHALNIAANKCQQLDMEMGMIKKLAKEIYESIAQKPEQLDTAIVKFTAMQTDKSWGLNTDIKNFGLKILCDIQAEELVDLDKKVNEFELMKAKMPQTKDKDIEELNSVINDMHLAVKKRQKLNNSKNAYAAMKADKEIYKAMIKNHLKPRMEEKLKEAVETAIPEDKTDVMKIDGMLPETFFQDRLHPHEQ